MKKHLIIFVLVLAGSVRVGAQGTTVNAGTSILPADWNPKLAVDLVMANVIKVTGRFKVHHN
ncbi:hypothetical protein [uncultured Imperialibacter sp.]|uniref:hypothetical protein n=1 Tax=uncultured Imperialibacter sp. TaxID=1672639 RepID=UPI0030D8B0D4